MALKKRYFITFYTAYTSSGQTIIDNIGYSGYSFPCFTIIKSFIIEHSINKMIIDDVTVTNILEVSKYDMISWAKCSD